MIYVQYDKASGEVKAFLRPSKTVRARASWVLEHYEEHAKGQPLADGADGVLVIDDERLVPKSQNGEFIPHHLWRVMPDGKVIVREKDRKPAAVSVQ